MAVPAIEIVRDAPKVGRTSRSPRHQFTVRQRPWQIKPVMIAPVLPGETMKNLLLQSRAVSSPIRHPLIGWWLEYYFFYVKHRDLDERDLVTEMHMTPGFDMTSLRTPGDPDTYHRSGINWTRKCLDRVVDQYFRDEGEGVNQFSNGGLPLATVWPPGHNSWLDSAKLESQIPAGGNDSELPGENPVIPDGIPAGFETHFTQWEHMRALKLTEATFEDYLKSFGVTPARELREDLHRPELLRYIREWTYPSNTIDALTGNPSSAVSWSVAERADKDRFFSEPGFIFGVSVVRPKVYMSKQVGQATHSLDDAYSWLPSVLSSEGYTSLRRFLVGPESNGPLGPNASEAYWVDMKDLFLYGDQVVEDEDRASGAPGFVALPDVNMQKRYPLPADLDSVFKAAGGSVQSDGVVSLSILSRLQDTSL